MSISSKVAIESVLPTNPTAEVASKGLPYASQARMTARKSHVIFGLMSASFVLFLRTC
jgi:hypothetical protein